MLCRLTFLIIPFSRTDLPGLIGTVHAALSGTSTPAQSNEKLTPPVPINKTIRPDYIISLEDGRRYKSMKRHLTGRGLTPESSTGRSGASVPITRWSPRATRKHVPNSLKRLGSDRKLPGGGANPKRDDGT